MPAAEIEERLRDAQVVGDGAPEGAAAGEPGVEDQHVDREGAALHPGRHHRLHRHVEAGEMSESQAPPARSEGEHQQPEVVHQARAAVVAAKTSVAAATTPVAGVAAA